MHARSLEPHARALEVDEEKIEKKEDKTRTMTRTLRTQTKQHRKMTTKKNKQTKTRAKQKPTKTKDPLITSNARSPDPQLVHNSTSTASTASTTTAPPSRPLTPTTVSPTTTTLSTESSMAEPTTAPELTPTPMTSPTTTEDSSVTEPSPAREPTSASPTVSPMINKEKPSKSDDPRSHSPKPTPTQEDSLKPEPSQAPSATEQPSTPSPTTVHVSPTTIKTTVSATSTTVIPTTTVVTTVPAPTTTSHSTPPTRTTTPWLPSTIVPIEPPQVTPAPSPGTSLPDAVIPDLHPIIPPNSMNVQLRFERVSYSQVINNGVLAAQLVSFIPAQLGHVLDVDPSLILVLVIRDGSLKIDSASDAGLNTIKKRNLVTTNSVEDAILVTVTIPRHKYWTLDTLVRNQGSILYFPTPTSFGQFLDSSFPLSKRPPSKSDQVKGSGGGDGGNGGNEKEGGNDDGGDDSSADPLTGSLPGMVDHKNNSNNPSHASIVGSVIGLATVAYVGIAILVLRRYRRKKVQEQERLAFQQSISAPIHVHGSTQGWSWQY
ncbi:hypothetical protein BGZ51_001662 [Haplosporangium sp. Z 767]|nr:hypothetical protein BGZ51_001662 [Haplosporangium sp. Z 767]KAF9188040.1 hypothetical protein BGZ50_001556 [Haplosporangium sp. Z 11]